MTFSLVKYLHLMHYPEIAMCKSLGMVNYLEKTSEDIILTNLLFYFIIRRMLYGYHQIFCNFISSDMELNISIGKLS